MTDTDIDALQLLNGEETHPQAVDCGITLDDAVTRTCATTW
ncbi:hypothetical protein ACFZAV_20160 [Streptomyces sp. NPDC008343]